MKEIVDLVKIEESVKKHNIRNYFETGKITFSMFEYENGELVNNIRNPKEYLQFLVEGTFILYQIREDGSMNPVGTMQPVSVLGDVEFSKGGYEQFWIEAKGRAVTIGISMKKYGGELRCDCRFLQYLLESVTDKMITISHNEIAFQTVEEKLLDYIRFQCENCTLKSVDEAVFHLHCSRRQLQRVLKKLTDSNVLNRIGKGQYILVHSIEK